MELLSGATLADGRVVSVAIDGETIAWVGEAGESPPDVASVTDLGGALLLPAPAEPHAHLDKALSADRLVNERGDLAGAIEVWSREREGLDVDDIAERASAALRTLVANGATAVRSHTDVGEGVGVRGIEALHAVRSAHAHLADLQIVAFASSPLTGSEGAANRRWLERALELGADVIGACPALDPRPPELIDLVLDGADSAGLAVDLHVDETLDPSVRTIELLAQAVLDRSFAGAVTASHCVSLGMQNPADQVRIAARIADAGIGVVTLPQTNLFLQARDHPTAPPRGLTAIRALRNAGAEVAGGGDNVSDPFNLVGRADPLETAALLVMAAHLMPIDAYDAVSRIARSVLGLVPGGIEVGAPAELLAIEAPTLRAAVAGASPNRTVWHRGRRVASTTTTVELANPSP